MFRHNNPILSPLQRLGINSYSSLPCTHTILPFQALLNFPRGKHLLRLFVQSTDKGKHSTRWQKNRKFYLVVILTQFWQMLTRNRSRYFQIFTLAKNNRHLPKSIKVHLRQNILAILFHNRINISEPNSETHVIRLQDERSSKIRAILLERGIGDPQNVATTADSQLQPTTVSSK